MPRLFNRVSKQVDFLSPEEAMSAWKAGTHDIPTSEPLFLRDANGETVRIESGELAGSQQDVVDALMGGAATFADEEHIAQKNQRDEVANEEFTTFTQSAALAAGNVLTAGGLGLAANLDESGSKLGRMVSEQKLRAETDPIAAGAGELIGTAASLGPMGAAAGLRGLGLIGEGVAEGAYYGAAEGIGELTENDLQHPAHAAEILAYSIGINAALGGAGGAAIKGGGILLAGAKKGATKALGKATEGVKKLWKSKTGQEMSEGAAELTTAEKLTDLGPAGKQAHRNVMDVESNTAKYTKEMVEDVNLAHTAKDAAEEAFKGPTKAKMYSKLVPESSYDDSVKPVSEIMSNYKATVTQYAERDEARGVGTSMLRDMQDEVDAVMTRFTRAKTATERYIELDNFKNAIGEHVTKTAKNAPGFAEDLKAQYSTLKNLLENVDLYGDAATTQRTVNQIWADLITNSKRFSQHFMAKSGIRDGWNEKMVANPKAVGKLLDSIGMDAKAVPNGVFERQIELVQKFITAVSEHADSAELKALQRQMDQVKARYGKLSEKYNDHNVYKELTKHNYSWKTDVFVAGTAYAAGSVVAGPVGGAISAGAFKAYNMLNTPGKRMEMLYRLNAAKDMIQKTAEKAFSRFAKEKAPARAAATAATPDLRKRYRDAIEVVNSAVSSPEGVQARVQEALGPTASAAPNVALSSMLTLNKALDYLRQALPVTTHTTFAALTGEDKPATVSRTEMSKFLAIKEALDDPTSLVTSMHNGTLRREAVLAVKEVYPEIYSTFVEAAVNSLAGKKLSYQKQVKLSLLLDTPLHPSVSGTSIARLQASFTQQSQQQSSGMPAPKPGKVSISLSTQTEEIDNKF